MSNNLTSIQESVLSTLENNLSQQVVEQAIPDINTVLRNQAGAIDPYVAIQFGDMQEGRRHNMAGVRYGDYLLPIYIQVVAPTPSIARGVYNKVLDVMLGETFQFTGNIRKRPGGGMWPIVTSNSATEAYIMPCSFSLLIQYA